MTLAEKLNIALAVATVLMALATVYLAYYTHELAKDTAEGMKQADRHHKEDLRPFCVIAFASADETRPFGDGFHQQQGKNAMYPSSSGSGFPLILRGKLSNKGSGPATEIIVYLNSRLGPREEDAFRLTQRVVVSGLVGAKEAIEIDVRIREQDVMSTWNGSAWVPVQVFHAVANDTYEIVLEYRDVFGNVFRTVHPRGVWADPAADAAAIGTRSKQLEMMARPNGPMPIFLTGSQAMRTAAEIKSLPQGPLPGDAGHSVIEP
jgi:hypothetical protein